jgi:hypothetical protein
MFSLQIDPARDSASTPTTSPRSPQAMANDRKRGFLSSLFGNRKQKADEEAAELESKQRLEQRIQQVLAERAAVPELLLIEENQPAQIAQMSQEEEADFPVELFPISASVLPIHKAPVQPAFVLSAFEAPRSYVSNQR